MNQKAGNLKEIFLIFLQLGVVSFGGPAAHIALMQKELVDKRKWVTTQHFLDLMGATNIIPGPNSTEMTMHLGYERGGWKGLFVAGGAFIFPAVLLTGIIAWFYQSYGHLPDIAALFVGIKPVVFALILGACVPLAKKALKSNLYYVLGVFTLILALIGVNEVLALFICGFLGVLFQFRTNNKASMFLPFPLLVGPWKVFAIFLKIGAILYGSGYVLFAFLEAELVETGLLSKDVLIDSIAVGQFTPGPVLSTATFIGWQMEGWQGAVMATIGIFLPSFLLVWILNPLVPKIRKSVYLSAFLDAINVGAVAVILSVAIGLGIDLKSDWKLILMAIIALFVHLKWKRFSPMLLILIGGLIGWIFI